MNAEPVNQGPADRRPVNREWMAGNPVRVHVNGDERDLAVGTTVATVVSRLLAGAAPRGIAVAVNGEVVPRADWTRIRLDAGDRVEVLTAAQGG